MKTVVSRGGVFIDGVPACARCARRPRRPVPATAKATRRTGRKYYSYCGPCHAEYVWEQRKGKVTTLLTPEDREFIRGLTAEERELILELRRVEPAGRHHAGLFR